MRAMPIRIVTGKGGWQQMKASFKKNRMHYLREASGLGIFMVSACFFGAMLFSEKSPWYHAIPNEMMRNVWMGVAMGATALFIFYFPWTSPSGSQINPAVTVSFLRLNKMCRYDAIFFIIFQIIGGTVAVYIMQLLMGTTLTEPPVNSVATVPGKAGMWWALITEFITAFITMSMVLFTSNHNKLKKFTRIFAGCLVCIWVMAAGPISGFGMNPARSFASALPAGIWAAFWIYLFIPIAGMLTAAELYLLLKRNPENKKYKRTKAIVVKKKNFEPFEFVL
jgi:aquaporin Z